MDQVLSFVHDILPFFHVLAALVILVKILWVIKTKGPDFPAIVISFFRIYNEVELNTSNNKKRFKYMRFNNFSNYYLYFWLFVTILIYVIFISQK